MNLLSIKKAKSGFTLVEALVGAAIFVILAMSVYQAFVTTMDVVRLSRVKITATALANEQFEIMRNLPYADVGIVSGLPLGKIPATQILIRDSKEFTVKTTIRNIDDPFDGTIGGNPNDNSPADYKLAELEITCPTCRNFPTMNLTTRIAPKALESASTNGAIFIKVFDSLGQPIPEANIHIENNQVIPAFSIDDTTNNDGLLQVVDAPPGNQAYEITVSKTGYTNDRTYAIGDPANPVPDKPHATVLLQQLTQISFIIDPISTLEIESVTGTCEAVPNIDFSLHGAKIIGTDKDGKDIYEYDEDNSTDDEGTLTIDNLDGDNYNLTFMDTLYNLAGAIPSTSFTLAPASTQNLKLIVAPKATTTALITVKDASTGLPLSDVNIQLTGPDYDKTLITGRGFIRQTDWSGGAGQNDFIDQTKYADSDSNNTLSIADPIGDIHLKNTLGEYAENSWLLSSTFDTGSASNFHQILWQPIDQPLETGANNVRLQIATNNDKLTWNYKGPDGTVNTYYTPTEQTINSIHNDDKYLRYKVLLQTASTTYTPTISDISFTFTSACVPPGQVFFNDLVAASYTINITKNGYAPYTNTIDTSEPWQQYEITLSP